MLAAQQNQNNPANQQMPQMPQMGGGKKKLYNYGNLHTHIQEKI